MKASGIVAVVTVAALAAGGGYWFGKRDIGAGHGGEARSAAGTGSPLATATSEPRKLLYYRNPMGLADTSPVPKKDSMGMDYIAVYAGDDGADAGGAAGGKTEASAEAGPNVIRISTEKIQKLGVRTEAAQLRSLDRQVRATGRVEADERRLYAIAPKFEGYVERLHVNITGQPVAKGQPLFDMYSPELVAAQREYLIARQGVEALKAAGGPALSGMQQLADSGLQRLKNWDVSDEQLQELTRSGEAKRILTYRSPVSGIVTEKKAVQGMRFMPGEALYQVADLSAVWVIADVVEQDIALVRNGALAEVRINAYPDKTFKGRVNYVYPTLKADTRTVAVRIELANPGLLLKPAMFADVALPVSTGARVLTVPVSAVLDSGTRQLVLVQLSEGRFEPRDVRLGARSDNYVEVLGGLKSGEAVVTSANFLIDAESNLRAALSGFGSAEQAASPVDQVRSVAPAVAKGSFPSSGQRETGVTEGPDKKGADKKASGHTATGVIEGIDAKSGMLTLNHGAVATLKWPAMTMDFKTANSALLKNLKVGARVTFVIVERKAGEWVITAIEPATVGTGGAPAAAGKAAPAANPHAHH